MTFIPIREITLEPLRLQQTLVQARRTDAALLFSQTSTHVAGRFDEGLNLANHFDFQYLPGKKWDGAYDPEGLLSTIPAIATCLFGVLAGLLLKEQRLTEGRKLLLLAGGGVISILLGYLWGLQFPVIKKLWTSSYVLVAGGWSCLLLAAFHQLIDRMGWRRWCEPFLWFGMNSIAIYLITHLIDFRPLADRLVGGPLKASLVSGVIRSSPGPLSCLLLRSRGRSTFAKFSSSSNGRRVTGFFPHHQTELARESIGRQ